MSLTNIEEIKCPCGESFEVEIVSCINVVQNPELKEQLIAGELNIVKCPDCFNLLYADQFLLYIDVAEELIAYVHPERLSGQEEQLKKTMDEDYINVQSSLNENEKLKCAPILIFGMDSLLKLLVYEDEQRLEMSVLEHYSKSGEDIFCLKIKPSLAREMHIPYYLPVIRKHAAKAGFSREDVLAGLEKLLELAPGLGIYRNLQTRILKDKNFDVNKLI